MSRQIPRKEFAKKCGINNNLLPVYVDRGKLVMGGTRCTKCQKNPRPCRECSGRQYIDLDYRTSDGFYINLDFFNKNAKGQVVLKSKKAKAEPLAKKTAAPVVIKEVQIKKSEPPVDLEDTNELSEKSSLARLEREKKFADIKKSQAATRIMEVEEQRLLGKLLPTELFQDAIHIFAESTMRSYMDAAEKFVGLVEERLQAQAHDKAFLREKLTENVRIAVNNAVKTAQKLIEDVSNDDNQTA